MPHYLNTFMRKFNMRQDRVNVDVFLTLHLSIILVINQLNAKNPVL